MITDLRKRPAPGPPAPNRPLLEHPVLALGFRPFFLLAGLFGTLYVPLWLVVFHGRLVLPTQLPPSAWHAHEMLFGFASAVLAGFLLTAARNWTGQPTPSGAPLAGLVLLWLLGRVAILLLGAVPRPLAAAVDLAFLPTVAVAIGVPIVRARNWKNLGLVALLLVLAGANLLFHAGPPAWTSRALELAVHVVVLVVIVMGGRVIPSFTANALRVSTTKVAFLDWSAFGVAAAAAGLDLVPGAVRIAGVASVVAGVLNGARMIGWRSLATRAEPLLWVLHVGYAWVAVGLVLSGLARFFPAWPQTAPTHALTVGAMAVLILGMMSRVSLGHTGRMLVVRKPMAVAFALLALAALVRAVGPLVLPGSYLVELDVSGALWALAFGTFVVVYAPVLTSARVDGKPG